MIHPVVGTGSDSSWNRPANKTPGCSCPPWRYCPRVQQLRPTNPECPIHGEQHEQAA
ncbi:hypothetical protein SEA_OTTAWA_13 [Arthrobacter phage Ottawa]|nr:hypothetical protein SEA_KHARCHO_13 [Arthrobacter phage Kharcho]WIC89245.1 hypothetical protein SEA_OTTAWA_13 [Arthrobacter phage Ottawa]